MRFKDIIHNFCDFTERKIDKIIREIEDKKRRTIAKDFQSTVDFLYRKGKKKEYGLWWLDELKYLEGNPFVDSISDKPTLFTKGREHKLVIRTVQSNYRLHKYGEAFVLDEGTARDVCRAYEFTYTYYKPAQEDNYTDIKLYFTGFSIDNVFDEGKKTIMVKKYEDNG